MNQAKNSNKKIEKYYKKAGRQQESIKTKYDGYVILTAVIVMLIITTSVSIGMLLISTSAVNSSGITLDGVRARQAADTCAEEALHMLRTDYNYTSGGGVNLTAGGATCNITEVTGTGAIDRKIKVEGYAGGVTSRVEVFVDELNPVLVSKWEYVSEWTY